MNLDNKYPLTALRIVPVAYMMSIGVFVVFGECQLASGAEGPWMTPTMSGRELQIFHIAVLGFVLFFIGGGERLLCYPFYGAALLSLITVLPNKEYLSRLVALDEEVVMEMRG